MTLGFNSFFFALALPMPQPSSKHYIYIYIMPLIYNIYIWGMTGSKGKIKKMGEGGRQMYKYIYI